MTLSSSPRLRKWYTSDSPDHRSTRLKALRAELEQAQDTIRRVRAELEELAVAYGDERPALRVIDGAA